MAANVTKIANKVFKPLMKEPGAKKFVSVGSVEKDVVRSVAERNAKDAAHRSALIQDRAMTVRKEFDGLSPEGRASAVDTAHDSAIKDVQDAQSENFRRNKELAEQQRQAERANDAAARADIAENFTESPSAAPSPPPPRTASDVMTERSFKGIKSQSDWTQTRAHNETVGINRDMQRVLDTHQAGKMDDGLAKKMGFGGAGDVSEQGIRDFYQGRLNSVKPETTTRDKMGYHKVPQKAAAVGGTAWLVNQMSQSKGQMSNAQLYGQSQQYGGM